MKRAPAPEVRLCGHCSMAPRHNDPRAAHNRCKGGECACGRRGHRPTSQIRALQAKATRLTIDQCVTRDRYIPVAMAGAV